MATITDINIGNSGAFGVFEAVSPAGCPESNCFWNTGRS
uniref:Uncharacterized protein n=1 Tax=Rhizophora mucronata TaxID=61149 RepID=A0A2P2Q1V3_RHIMU